MPMPSRFSSTKPDGLMMFVWQPEQGSGFVSVSTYSRCVLKLPETVIIVAPGMGGPGLTPSMYTEMKAPRRMGLVEL